jgi:hypothetical protein
MRWSLRGKVVGLHDTHRTHEIQSRTYCIIAADSLATSNHMQVNETLVPPTGCCPKPKAKSPSARILVTLCSARRKRAAHAARRVM